VSDVSQTNSRIQICILPAKEEDDDLETLSLVKDVRLDFLTEISQSDLFVVEPTMGYRGATGFITLILKVAHSVYSQKNRIAQLFQGSRAAVEALSKLEYVQKIDMTIDGNTIHIEKASDAQVNRLIDIYEANHPGKLQQIMPSSTVEIIGTVSKKEFPAIAEKSVADKDE